MGRSPFCDENGLKKGPWTPEEDQKLVAYIQKHGHGSWRALPNHAGLNRCGKSCRLRWINYLRADIKRGKFSSEEERTILNLHSILGNKWSTIATHLPGRTDNEVKNFWNTHLKKRLIQMGLDPITHRPRTDLFTNMPYLMALANIRDIMACQHHYYQLPLEDQSLRLLQAEAVQLAKVQYLQCVLQSTEEVGNSATNINNIADIEAVSMLELSPTTRSTEVEVETCNIDNSNCSFDIALASSNPFVPQSRVCSPPNLQIPTHFQTPCDQSLNRESNPPDSNFSGLFRQGDVILESLLLPPLISGSHDQTANSVSNLADVSTSSIYLASSFWPDLFLEEPLIQEIGREFF